MVIFRCHYIGKFGFYYEHTKIFDFRVKVRVHHYDYALSLMTISHVYGNGYIVEELIHWI